MAQTDVFETSNPVDFNFVQYRLKRFPGFCSEEKQLPREERLKESLDSIFFEESTLPNEEIINSYLQDSTEQIHFLGFGKNNNLLKNLIRLRQGLVFNEELQKQIFYEKLNFMIILLSPEKKWRNCDRRLWHFFPHNTKCLCDYQTVGCRKKRLLQDSILRLQKLNREYQKIKEHFMSKTDSKLQKFHQRNKEYVNKAEDKLRERNREKMERRKQLLKISALLEKEHIAKKEKSVQQYRHDLQTMKAEEEARRRRVQTLPPLVPEKSPEQTTVVDEVNTTQISPQIKIKLKRKTVNRNPPIKKDKPPRLITKLPELVKLQELRKERTPPPPPSEKPPLGDSLPYLTSVKNKLKISLKKQNSIPLKLKKKKSKKKKDAVVEKDLEESTCEQPEDTVTETLEAKQKVESTKLPKVKKTKRPIETRVVTEEKIPVVKLPVKSELTDPVPKKEKTPNYLEVDLGKQHSVQQIVLEQKDPKTHGTRMRRKGRRHSKSFTLSYSSDGIQWLDYNDAVGNTKVFRDEEEKAFSIHVLDESLVTRYLRVHPTSEKKNRLRIKETLLGIEYQQDDDNNKGDVARQPRKKHTKRIMDTAAVIKPFNPSPEPVASIPNITKEEEDEPIFSDKECHEIQLEFENFNDFQDDLLIPDNEFVPLKQSPGHKRERKISTAMFSMDDIQSDLDREELLRQLNEEEDMRRKEMERQVRLRRNRLLAERKHHLNKQLENKSVVQRVEKRNVEEDKEVLNGEKVKNENLDYFDDYCIYTKDQLEWYRAIYDDFQEHEVGSSHDFLPLSAALDGLSIINKSLVTDKEYQYIFRVLETFDVTVMDGMNFRIFSLIASFSERIKTFKKYFNVIGENLSYPEVTPCLSKAKELYKMLLQPNRTVIEIEDFLIEMQAAKMDQNVVRYILQNEEMSKIDFLDHLTFFPLFLHAHDRIVDSFDECMK